MSSMIAQVESFRKGQSLFGYVEVFSFYNSSVSEVCDV
ncbi:hypothetical protein BVRB_002830 [Beta vulgaris subsp. vulgaris]|uniref:Uncharacterized protein n=1 Tax=Beta vulgaris subsp. vulgaris TaxID=3555 RepID=A0A0J8B4D1_BETVV|nr:hypothetical protein BVRB_002830 [Beta vulgaris subsp. vulgaris]